MIGYVGIPGLWEAGVTPPRMAVEKSSNEGVQSDERAGVIKNYVGV